MEVLHHHSGIIFLTTIPSTIPAKWCCQDLHSPRNGRVNLGIGITLWMDLQASAAWSASSRILSNCVSQHNKMNLSSQQSTLESCYSGGKYSISSATICIRRNLGLRRLPQHPLKQMTAPARLKDFLNLLRDGSRLLLYHIWNKSR